MRMQLSELLIFQLANKVDCLSDVVYAYRIHGESITQKHDENPKRVDSYWIMLLMAEIQKKMEIPLTTRIIKG